MSRQVTPCRYARAVSGAKLVPEFAEDITPQEELDKLNAPFETVYIRRDRGTGRPTKKERRDLDRLMDELL